MPTTNRTAISANPAINKLLIPAFLALKAPTKPRMAHGIGAKNKNHKGSKEKKAWSDPTAFNASRMHDKTYDITETPTKINGNKSSIKMFPDLLFLFIFYLHICLIIYRNRINSKTTLIRNNDISPLAKR